MSTHGGSPLLYLVAGVVLSLIGALIVRYPEDSYLVPTAWKHDEASLSSAGRTDQRLMGAVVLLIGIGLFIQTVS